MPPRGIEREDIAVGTHLDPRVRIEIGDWIVRAALAGATEIELVEGVCERMNAADLSLVRASVANDLLDPTFGARGVRWLSASGGLEEAFERVDESAPNDEWTRSPFFALLEGRRPMMRRRLDHRIGAANSRCSTGSSTMARPITWRSPRASRKRSVSARAKGSSRRG